MPIVLKSGSLNLLEHSGPVQDCNGIALPSPLPLPFAFTSSFNDFLPKRFVLLRAVGRQAVFWVIRNSTMAVYNIILGARLTLANFIGCAPKCRYLKNIYFKEFSSHSCYKASNTKFPVFLVLSAIVLLN